MFGMSFVYIIFKDGVEFYWSRSRILEKLNSLPAGTLPAGVQPTLGPDATALGQIFWYTLEGRDPKTGQPNGGWDPQELRTIQDFYVKYGLTTAEGVSEVASVGGYIKEYQIDLKTKPEGKYDAVILAVGHKQYVKLDETYFTPLLTKDGIVVDVKGILRGKIKDHSYWSL